jgi:hypothetical protein
MKCLAYKHDKLIIYYYLWVTLKNVYIHFEKWSYILAMGQLYSDVNQIGQEYFKSFMKLSRIFRTF